LANVTAIAGGANHSVALKSDGTVVCWGDNSQGQSTVPANLTNVVSISAGDNFTLVRRADGSLVSWGLNDLGQATIPTGLANVTGIACGGAHALALSTWSLSGSVSAVTGGSVSPLVGTISTTTKANTDRVVSLTSSDPSISVPTTVVIRANKTVVTFDLSHNEVPNAKAVLVSAKIGGQAVATGTIRVTPFVLSNFSFTPAGFQGGQSTNGTVSLAVAARNAVTVRFVNDGPDVVKLPESVTIAANSTTATFPVTTEFVSAERWIYIHAFPGTSTTSSTAYLVLLPAPKISTLVIVRQTSANRKRTGQILLRTPATVEGNTVTLSTNVPGIRLPASVFLNEGETSATFEYESADVPATTDVIVSATCGPNVESRTITVRPVVLEAITVSSSVKGGTSADVTVKLTGVVDIDTDVAVSSSSDLVTFPAGKITVRAGQDSATVSVKFAVVTRPKPVTIVAAKNVSRRQKVVRIVP
jgi:hypothetical protein